MFLITADHGKPMTRSFQASDLMFSQIRQQPRSRYTHLQRNLVHQKARADWGSAPRPEAL
ncbi:hypothetical protein PG995_009955 [Apiospora arundinis]